MIADGLDDLGVGGYRLILREESVRGLGRSHIDREIWARKRCELVYMFEIGRCANFEAWLRSTLVDLTLEVSKWLCQKRQTLCFIFGIIWSTE